MTAYFNSQPREGGWLKAVVAKMPKYKISTHSRAKAAGFRKSSPFWKSAYFNSQPREGGWDVGPANSVCGQISTHSRAKAAGNAIPGKNDG